MNIDELKRFFEFVLNKNQVGGNTTPTQFNDLVRQAQIDLFNEYYNPVYREGSVTNRGYEVSQNVTDFFNNFIVDTFINFENGVADLPADYSHKGTGIIETYISDGEECNCDKGGDCGQMGYGVVRFIMNHQRGHLLSSKIAPPTIEFPYGNIRSGKIFIYPKEVLSIAFSYIRKPKTPKWDYTLTPSNRPVYNPLTSVDVEIPIEWQNELLAKMLKYKGINIREAQLSQYAQGKDIEG